MIYRAMDFWQGLQDKAWISSCGLDRKFIQKSIDYTQNSHATIAQVGTFWMGGHYSSVQGQAMAKTIGILSSTVGFAAPSGTMRTSQ